MKKKLLIGLVIVLFGIAGVANATPIHWESNYGNLSDLSDEDDDSEKYNLGFDFTFYGATFNSVWVNSNGVLQFEDDDYDYEVGDEIEDDFGRVIAPFWADLYPSEEGEIYYNTLGTTGNQRFVVTWDDVLDYAEEFKNTFQVVLYESGLIQFGYDNLLGSDDGAGENVIGVSQGDGTHFNYFIAADGSISGIYPNGNNLFYNWNPTSLNYDMSETYPVSEPVPEPATMLLFGTGLAGLLGTRLIRRKKK
ncbi:PEP-CTERM protein-sorting domain-containing protein [Candidatus Magnetomoraceae bacterium gMMP-15]